MLAYETIPYSSSYTQTHVTQVCVNCSLPTAHPPDPPVTSGPGPNWGEGRWIFFSMLVLLTYACMACGWNKIMLRARRTQLDQVSELASAIMLSNVCLADLLEGALSQGHIILHHIASYEQMISNKK